MRLLERKFIKKKNLFKSHRHLLPSVNMSPSTWTLLTTNNVMRTKPHIVRYFQFQFNRRTAMRLHTIIQHSPLISCVGGDAIIPWGIVHIWPFPPLNNSALLPYRDTWQIGVRKVPLFSCFAQCTIRYMELVSCYHALHISNIHLCS